MSGGRETDEDIGATVSKLEEGMGVDAGNGSYRGSSWQSQSDEQSKTVAQGPRTRRRVAADSARRLRSMLPLFSPYHCRQTTAMS